MSICVEKSIGQRCRLRVPDGDGTRKKCIPLNIFTGMHLFVFL